MIFVDSSVWIDFYRGVTTRHVDRLAAAIADRQVLVGDLVLMEVLQGLRNDREAAIVQADLLSFKFIEVAGRDITLAAARNYRALRARGITIRKTIDVLIATRCILEGWPLLHRDRDFAAFEAHLGLASVIPVE